MTPLPIDSLLEEIRRATAQHSRIILSAPTGSGKSTRVAPMLVDHCPEVTGQVVVLQPRRLAARMLAARVATERGGHPGEETGYQIRFERVAGPKTKILFVTEGILLRRMLSDPLLQGVSAILFDEFHERHLYTDITLARAVALQESHRPDLKLFVMSATLSGLDVAAYLGPSARIDSEGRTFPVEIDYLPQNPGDEPPWETAARALEQNWHHSDGHALVFMPGAFEIQRSISAIQARLGHQVPVLPLHGEMTGRDQDRAVAAEGPRRIIVSTNVAETSLTIDGVTLVIDSGLARVARFDARRGIDTLLIEKISRASADQRAGRAGRTRPGRCLRLWTRYDHERRPEQEIPEIKRMDLAEVVLALKAAGFENLDTFRWLEPPDPTALDRARLLLEDIGAIDPENGGITTTGRRMMSFPVHPRYARMFLEAEKLGCVRSAALLAALTQTRSLLAKADRQTLERRDELFGGGSSDFHRLARAFSYAKNQNFNTGACRNLGVHAEAARQAARLFEQFLRIAEQEGLTCGDEPASDEAIAKCMLAGFADQVARRRSMGTLVCDLVHGRRGMLARDSLARDSRLIVAGEINEIGRSSGEAEVVLGLAAEIEQGWLEELYPHHLHREEIRCFDSGINRVVQRRQLVFRDLVLEMSDHPAPPDSATAACLAGALANHGIVPPLWNATVEQLIARINFAAAQAGEQMAIPAIGETDRELLLAQVCEGAVSARDLKDKPVLPCIRQWLTSAQMTFVESFAPEKIDLPGGRPGRVRYDEQGATLSATMQQLFGVKGGLTVGYGRIPVTFEILAPNQRPVQVTRDLGGFWRETYPVLKQQLQRVYPKHRWPDDPLA